MSIYPPGNFCRMLLRDFSNYKCYTPFVDVFRNSSKVGKSDHFNYCDVHIQRLVVFLPGSGIRSLVTELLNKMYKGRTTFWYRVEIELNPIFTCNHGNIKLFLEEHGFQKWQFWLHTPYYTQSSLVRRLG